MNKLMVLSLSLVAVLSSSCANSALSNDEYDRLYMANKEFKACDTNGDGVLTMTDTEAIKNFNSRLQCQELLKSSGAAELTLDEYVDIYSVPENTIDGEQIANIVYKSVGDQRLMLDLYLPNKSDRPAGLMPVVIFYHGGGWRNGDKHILKTKGTQPIVDELLKKGIAVASANYRFIIDGEQYVPTVISDAKDVVAFMNRDGEKYGIDGGRVIVWGGSAGGHLSLMCGFSDVDSFPGDAELSEWRQKPTGVVSWYGSGDFTLGSWEDAVARGHESFYRCFTDSQDTEVLKAKGYESSPLEHITSDDSPTILFGGDADVIVSINDATQMYAKLQKCGVESEIVVVHGAGHGWSGKDFTPNKEQINVLTYNAVLTLLGMDI